MVGAERFELPTLCSQSRCATRLRYAPTGRASYAVLALKFNRLFAIHAFCQAQALASDGQLKKLTRQGDLLLANKEWLHSQERAMGGGKLFSVFQA